MDSVSELPFLVFVAVADAAQSVGAVEADAYVRLLERRDWASCPALVSSLPEALRRYPEHWRRYVAGEIDKSVPAVVQAVRSATTRFSAESSALLEGDLLHIADTLRKAARQDKLKRQAKPGHAFGALEAALRAAASDEQGRETAVTAPAQTNGRQAPEDAVDWLSALVSRAQPWDSVRTRLRCVRMVDETADVRTFAFVSDQKRPFCYKPGQFLTLEIEMAGKKVRRNYTISSSPSRPDLITLTVKRVPGGLVSNWIHDHLTVGEVLPAVIANGKFNCWDIEAEKVLFLSAGIGITPVMSMARWQADLDVDRDTVFFHVARTPSSIVFRRELERLQGPRFKLILNCTRPSPDEEWNGLRGRLDVEAVKMAVPDHLDRMVFMCGPEPWMKSMREHFSAAGLPPNRIHQEYFGPRSWATAPPDSVLAAVHSNGSGRARIVFARSHKEVECGTDEPILEVAERVGIEIASSCRVGACGTCKALKTSGVVNNGFCPGLDESEAAQGYVLTCSTTVEGTVVIDA
ncbi:MAG: 2Fe-2S iron-sulfur cluster-binding protein [Vicinamibacterales bacterium]